MDYSWYGAGFIRWGFRGEDGDVIYVHKIPNNNFNTDAYMRSGNLPARYEVNTIPPATTATKSFGSGDTTIYVTEAPYGFPDTGTLRIRQTTSATAANSEYINYTGTLKFAEDVIAVTSGNDAIEVADTSALQGGGVQTVVFDRPFSNIVANKTYYVATVLSGTLFTITDTPSSSVAIALNDEAGTILSPLAVAKSGAFTGCTREQAGNTGVNLTIADGASTGTVSSSTGIQKGQRVIGSDIPDDTFVYDITGSAITLSKAVTAANPQGVTFAPLGTGSASAFTYSATQPIGLELIGATSVPQISHWGSSVIMEGEYDDDRAYVYSVAAAAGKAVSQGGTEALLALRISPSVSNGTSGSYGARELVNRMQLVLDSCQIVADGAFYVELILNPTLTNQTNWINVPGTSLAQYAIPVSGTDTQDGEVIFSFFSGSDGGTSNIDLSQVKEISNSILGGGYDYIPVKNNADPVGVFPDGPEVLVARVTNIGGSVGGGNQQKESVFKFSWTEAQA